MYKDLSKMYRQCTEHSDMLYSCSVDYDYSGFQTVCKDRSMDIKILKRIPSG